MNRNRRKTCLPSGGGTRNLFCLILPNPLQRLWEEAGGRGAGGRQALGGRSYQRLRLQQGIGASGMGLKKKEKKGGVTFSALHSLNSCQAT